jgi:hypothetical protein
MGLAKEIVVRPITSAEAREVVRRVHYSGKVVNNSTLHLGVFYAGRLEGAMQFGSPLDRRKVLPMVSGTEWNQMLELNRMAFTDALPRNSESRAMAVAFRLLRRHRPDIKWILSFSDATQCGDGTIYRAAGFVLTGVKVNTQTWKMPDGSVVSRTSMTKAQNTVITSGAASMRGVEARGGRPLPGYQLRYIYFLDQSWRSRLTVPVIPFDRIPDDARMYRGVRQPVGGAGVQPADRPCKSDPGAPPPTSGGEG